MDLQTPIYKLSDKDVFTLDDCTLGTMIFGSIGSGKTSGPGESIARAFLRKGMGGLVLTAKVGETKRWVEYAKKENRLNDVVVFSPGSDNRLEFNPLLYELRSKKGGREVENLVGLFSTAMQMQGRATMQSGGGSSDPFWIWAMERLLKNTFHLLILSGRYDLTMTNIVKVISDIPTESDFNSNAESALLNFEHFIQTYDEDGKHHLEEMGKKSFTVHCLTWAYTEVETPAQLRIFEAIKSYFLSDFPKLASKTRSGIKEQLFAFIDPFRTGMLAEYFTEGVSDELLPERTFEGKIIVLDLPVKEWMNLGVVGQGMYKYAWQKRVEQRDTNKFPMPVFLFQDEYHLFSNRYDNIFNSTARESKCCIVNITQNLPNLYALIGGSHPRDYVGSIIGNLATKIYCANDEVETNSFAARSIGESFVSKNSINFGTSNGSGGSFSDQRQFQVEPIEFTMFRRGGPRNDFKVDAIVTSTGRTFSNEKNHFRAVFLQNR